MDTSASANYTSAMAEARTRRRGRGPWIAIGTVALLAVAGEVGMRGFFVRSHAWDHTLAARGWLKRYWKPINDAGFRDVEHEADRLRTTRRLVVLGDSIAAGAGIESVDARFSGRLAQRLGEHWSVVVLARRGWDTTEQRRALSNFAYEPHVGLLAYYVNDVVRACAAKSAPFAVDLGEPPALLAPLVARSHLANHLYWSAAMYVRGPELARAYFEYLQRCYDSAGVWRALAGDLDGLVRDARSRGARVVALCFPALGNIPATADHTRKVAAFLAGLGVEAIDLAPVYSARDVDELVVHAFDQHPNARVHAEVAKLVLPLVTAPVSRP